MKFVPVALVAVAASFVVPAHALVLADLTGALDNAATLLGGVETQLLAIGTVILGLAVIGAGIKWVKGTIFS